MANTKSNDGYFQLTRREHLLLITLCQSPNEAFCWSSYSAFGNNEAQQYFHIQLFLWPHEQHVEFILLATLRRIQIAHWAYVGESKSMSGYTLVYRILLLWKVYVFIPLRRVHLLWLSVCNCNAQKEVTWTL